MSWAVGWDPLAKVRVSPLAQFVGQDTVAWDRVSPLAQGCWGDHSSLDG